MQQPIKVTYKSTTSAYTANQWLHSLPDLIACDFEAAIKYTSNQLAEWQRQLDEEDLSKLERKHLESLLSATALDHPSHVVITHLQIAISETESYVLILDNKKITDLVLTFLVTTTKKQIWHNASYDFRLIYYFTGKMPLNYEDTALRAKCILNHVEIYQAKVGLKQLAGAHYGAWAISPDHFTVDQMYDEKVLLYAATDSCATYWLWYSINRHVKEANENSSSTK